MVALRSVFPAEFDPRIVKGYVPIVVGVPVMAAVDAFNDNPGGRLPVRIENVGAGYPAVLGATLRALPFLTFIVAA
jgi:hypothetical protein